MNNIKNTSNSLLVINSYPVDIKTIVGDGYLFEDISDLLTRCPKSALFDGMLIQDTINNVTWQLYYNGSTYQAKLYDGKFKVKAVSLVSIESLSGTKTIDGVSCIAEDIVLLVGQQTPHMNGVWVVKSGTWERHAIFNVSTDGINFPGVTFIVSEGTYKNSQWKLTTVGDITMSNNPADFFTATWLDFEAVDPTKNSLVYEISTDGSVTRFNKFNLVDCSSGDVNLLLSASLFSNEEYSVIKTDQSSNYVILNSPSGSSYPLWILKEQNDFVKFFVTSDYSYHFQSNRKNLLLTTDAMSDDGKLSLDVPAGYLLWGIYVTATDAIDIDFGTTSGGTDLGTHSCTTDETFLEIKDEITEVWVSDNSGTGWDGVSITCKLLLISLNPSLV